MVFVLVSWPIIRKHASYFSACDRWRNGEPMRAIHGVKLDSLAIVVADDDDAKARRLCRARDNVRHIRHRRLRVRQRDPFALLGGALVGAFLPEFSVFATV